MRRENKDKLLDIYTNNLADIQQRNIECLNFGFIAESCNTNMFSILIECIKNIEIFNTTQLYNINDMINKLSYG